MPNEAPNQIPEEDAMTLAMKNNPCGLCRAMGSPTCKGHGSGEESDKAKDKDVTASNQATRSVQLAPETIKELDAFKSFWIQSQLSSDRIINYDAGLLSIQSERVHGNFSFHIKPELSKEEIEIAREFLEALKTEFDEFKDQLVEEGISMQNLSADLKDNELTAHISNPKYYDEFIKHLENKNLLPVPNPKRQEKKEIGNELYEQEKKASSPFDAVLKGPKPQSWE